MLGETIVLHILESGLFHGLRHGYLRLRFIKCAVVNPLRDIRVAFSALLLVREGDSYLLIKNLHRPESFGPLGGVFKHKDSAFLDRLEFKPQTFGTDMIGDLRGFLPRKHLAALVGWFKKAHERESASDCLARELNEEVREAGLSKKVKCPEVVPLRLVRSVQEGPENVPGEAYTQYRIFEIYELDAQKKSIKAFEKQLLNQAHKGHPSLILVTAEEIVSGRAASGQLIGHHAGYLFGTKRVRPDSPMFKTHSIS